MGAGATKRGNKLIRRQLEDESDEMVQVRRSYLSRMDAQFARLEKAAEEALSRAEYAEEELRRARMLVDRLRAENNVLKEEKAVFANVIEKTRRYVFDGGSFKAKWVIALIENRLERAGLI